MKCSVLLVKWVLAIIFLLSATLKTLYPDTFLMSLATLLPGNRHGAWVAVAILVVLLEWVIAGLLVFRRQGTLGAWSALTALALFTAALLRLPPNVPCGCFGDSQVRWIQWISGGIGAILRNLVLILLASWIIIAGTDGRKTKSEEDTCAGN